jgi:two-component system response regulator CpxR
MSVIALVSESYCAGEEIARQVAERLGYSLVSQELYEAAADKFDVPVETLQRALSGERSLLEAFTRDYERSVSYVKAVLSQMLIQQYFVFHGVAMRLIPQAITHVLRVGIVGEKPFRMEAAVAAEGCDADMAQRLIDQADKRLTSWAQHHLGRGFWEPEDFDLIVPRPGKTVDEAVDLIAEAVTRDALLPTDRSVQAQLDFLLATRVNLALLERRQLFSEVTAASGRVVVKVRTKRGQAGLLGRAVDALRREPSLDEARRICAAVPGVKEVEVVTAALAPRTLLVDDEPEFVTTLSERLRTRDVSTDVAFDGPEALAAVQANEPAVIVLDLRMPGMDGLEVLERVRRDHPRVHVIVLTGHGSDEDEARARALGAFDFLRKPVDITTLAARIAEARQRHRSDPDD